MGVGSAWFAAVVAGALESPPVVWGAPDVALAPVAIGDLAAALAVADDLDVELAGTWSLEGPDVVTAGELVDMLAGPAEPPESLEGEAARVRLSGLFGHEVSAHLVEALTHPGTRRCPRRRGVLRCRAHAARRRHPAKRSPRPRRPAPTAGSIAARWGSSCRFEVDDGVGVIRLDRPPANAIDLQMATELGETITEAGERNDVGALVVWGGERIFAAGADVKAMAEWDPDEVRPSVDALGAACDALETIPKVVIAAVTGFALGGGLELALGADFRLLADDATVGQPEIKLGVIPGAGGTQRLSRLVGPARTRDLVYSGRLVEARRGPGVGTRRSRGAGARGVLRGDGHRSEVRRGPAAGAGGGEDGHRRGVRDSRARRYRRERELFLDLFGTPDQREGMRAFLDKRDPRFGTRNADDPRSSVPVRVVPNPCSHTMFTLRNEPVVVRRSNNVQSGAATPSRPPVPSERM